MSATKTYLLDGLCCENCAAAIERESKALAGVSSAKVDYAAKTITVDFNTAEDAVFKSVSAVASEIDEDIVTKRL
jgi:Cd2+/Zn2+-exporting ATPase